MKIHQHLPILLKLLNTNVQWRGPPHSPTRCQGHSCKTSEILWGRGRGSL